MRIENPKTTLRQWAFLFGIALLVILIDQVVKIIVVANLELYETWVPVKALKAIFDFTHTQNTGAAFGMFRSASTFFLIVAVIASIVIVHYYRQVDGRAWLIRLAMGLQLGGALGNAIDRVVRGSVVDFIHVFYKPLFDFPVFNIADSSIVIGVGLLMLLLWREDRAKKPEIDKSLIPEEE